MFDSAVHLRVYICLQGLEKGGVKDWRFDQVLFELTAGSAEGVIACACEDLC